MQCIALLRLHVRRKTLVYFSCEDVALGCFEVRLRARRKHVFGPAEDTPQDTPQDTPETHEIDRPKPSTF